MNKIVYVDGQLADQIGERNLYAIADLFSSLVESPVELHTLGESQYHGSKRIIGKSRGASRGYAALMLATREEES